MLRLARPERGAGARSNRWLAQLDRAEPLLAGKRLHVGHGAPGGPELIEEQKRCIRAYRDAVRDLASGRDSLTDDAQYELARRMDKIRPDAALADLIGMSADPIA